MAVQTPLTVRIAITGRRRRGKDTLADIISRVMYQPTQRIALADPLKRELAEMSSTYLALKQLIAAGRTMIVGPREFADADDIYSTIEREQRKFRELNGPGWQWWGEYMRWLYGEDYWLKLFDKSLALVPPEHHVVVTDMRHPNEAEHLGSLGFFRVRVAGPYRGTEADQRDDNHPSERHIDTLPVDDVYPNDGSLTAMEQYVRLYLIPHAVTFARRRSDGRPDHQGS